MAKYSDDYIARRVAWYHECYDLIDKAEYKKAMMFSKKGLRLFPDDTVAAFTYHSILADYALSSKSIKFQKMHKVAIAGMKKLLKRTAGRDMG